MADDKNPTPRPDVEEAFTELTEAAKPRPTPPSKPKD